MPSAPLCAAVASTLSVPSPLTAPSVCPCPRPHLSPLYVWYVLSPPLFSFSDYLFLILPHALCARATTPTTLSPSLCPSPWPCLRLRLNTFTPLQRCPALAAHCRLASPRRVHRTVSLLCHRRPSPLCRHRPLTAVPTSPSPCPPCPAVSPSPPRPQAQKEGT